MALQHSGSTIDVLFFGDLVGRPGREAVMTYLAEMPSAQSPNLVIANVENATHGFGISQKHYQELLRSGVHVMTGGNHIWDRDEIFQFIDRADCLVRPANFNKQAPGKGWRVFDLPGGHKLGVVSLLGQVFMGAYNSPWDALEEAVAELKQHTAMIFLDMHAETTAEKMAMGWFANSLGVSAVVGTHTHVQTADAKILNEFTGYLTDAGFNGAEESVIGMRVEGSLKRMRGYGKTRMDVPDQAQRLQVNAVRFRLDTITGGCLAVERVFEVITLSPAAAPASPETSPSPLEVAESL
jgi:2',3'-cyclic-nucleotide 2'-phosphodiesterase